MDIISDEKFKTRFAKFQNFLEENIYRCPENITFQTLARIKEICPECELGEKLFITGTNLSTQKHEVFSIDTTPSMALADAIIISANLPIAFERICYQGNVYSDGGISNNLPAHCFSEKGHKTTFLKHKDDVDFSVLALQFDNGLEENALYSQNPIPKWSWLSNTFYSLITGHPNVTENWYEDLQILRRHAHQSILIKTPTIALTNLTISQDTKKPWSNQDEQLPRPIWNSMSFIRMIMEISDIMNACMKNFKSPKSYWIIVSYTATLNF